MVVLQEEEEYVGEGAQAQQELLNEDLSSLAALQQEQDTAAGVQITAQVKYYNVPISQFLW